MKTIRLNGLLIVLALLFVCDTTYARSRPHKSRSNSRYGVSHCNSPGLSITWSSGNVRSRIRPYDYYRRRYPYHRCPTIRQYPKRFPLGPVIVYSSSKSPVEIQPKVIVVITNDNGSQTPVELTKLDGGGYRGPKGEYYSQLPTEGQLRALYGLSNEVSTIAELQTASTVVTVWIDNENGSKTPVQLVKQGRSYIGPDGEYYPTMPTNDQLKAVYGLYNNASSGESTTIVIHNSDGTTSSVLLVKEGDSYIGPNGEYYTKIPSAKQLVPIYGH